MTLFLTTAEQQAWQEHARFFEPDGVLDLDACDKYLEAHLKQEFYPHHVAQKLPFFFALLKKSSELPCAEKAFVRMYSAMRKDSVELNILTGHLADGKPSILRHWLQQAAQDVSDITARIFVLRDAKAYFPDDDIRLYTNGQLLKVKPSVFIKKFTPTASDMEALLAVGVDFRKTSGYEELGTLLVQGVFISMYGKECDTKEKNPETASELEEKYSARAAFDLMERYTIGIAPSELLQLLSVRYHGTSLHADALAYTYESLLSDDTAMREYGLQILDAVLEHQRNKPDTVYNKGLLSIYGALDKERNPENDIWLQRIKGALLHYVAQDQEPMQSTGDLVAKAPQLLDPWLTALQKRTQDPDNHHLLETMCFEKTNALYGGLFWFYDQHALVREWVHNTTNPSQLTRVFEDKFNSALKRYNPKSSQPFQNMCRELKHALKTFSQHPWPQEKLTDLKASTNITKWVLTYLLAHANMEMAEGFSQSSLPTLTPQPLLFLRRIYPEHQELWNVMTKSNLVHPAHDLPSSHQQHRQLFGLFSQAFLPTAPSLEQIESIAQLMETDPLTVLLKSCESAHALELDQLDDSLFLQPL